MGANGWIGGWTWYGWVRSLGIDQAIPSALTYLVSAKCRAFEAAHVVPFRVPTSRANLYRLTSSKAKQLPSVVRFYGMASG
jgi:carboxypeptidase C (cathepsin A)